MSTQERERFSRRDAPPTKPPGDLFDRAPPHSMEAERGVLGSLLLDPRMCDEVAMVLRPEEFYSPGHRKLFEVMLDMHNEGKQIDPTLLIERLKSTGDFEMLGGTLFLADILEAVPTAANAVWYSQIVRDKAVVRDLIHASTEILRDAYDQSQDPRELLAQAESKVFGILEQKGSNNVAGMADILHETMLRIDDRISKGGGIGGISTGLRDLDTQTGGLHDSELVILAARPSMGKTALATTIAENVAMNDKNGVLFVSLEMSRLELAERMLCSRGRINGHNLRNGILSSGDRKKLIEASSDLSQAPIYIDDSPSRTMTEIAAAARRLKRREGLRLVVIDYLQLIEPDNHKDQRQEQVSKIARRLKGMARELKVPVLCLSQLNRQAEASKDNRPKLSHLRESGAIEQDADVVMFVHREEYYMTNEEDKAKVAGKADLIIAKQRNGPVGDVRVAWRQNFTRFEDLAKEEYSFD
ncbi:MAG: replicative DNA helicase [Planctomycetaceae bacterium]|nr:replicative DNA helicase [Planctomycetaceae bacterium]